MVARESMAASYDEELARFVAAFVVHLDEQHPWRLDALCREHAELDWHRPATPATRAVCAQCLVASECAVFLGRRTPRPRARRASKPTHRRLRCDGCGGVLPPGRVGLCCECEEHAAA
jgi:hypothetical protein